MTTPDQNKLLDAGFTLVKARNYPRPGGKSTRFEIKQKTPQRRTWHENGWNYANLSDRDQELRKLARNKNTIYVE